MSVRIYGMLTAVSLLAVGCRQDPYHDAYLETLRAEKLWLEDRMYDMEYQYEAQLADLDAYRQENVSLRKQLGLETADATDIQQRRSESASPRTNESDLDTPSIEFGTPTSPDNANVPGRFRIPMSASSSSATPANYESPAALEAFDPNGLPTPFDTRITHIVINPQFTSGHDFDRRSGDDGISVVIEPRNAEDQYVAKAGPVSLVILDPQLEGEAARVARWDLNAHEVGRRIKPRAVAGYGIHLKLPWQDDPPTNSRLLLFVRYETDDGRKVEADTEIDITLAGQFSGRWTPKSMSLTKSPKKAQPKHLKELDRSLTDGSSKDQVPRLQQASTIRRPVWSPQR